MRLVSTPAQSREHVAASFSLLATRWCCPPDFERNTPPAFNKPTHNWAPSRFHAPSSQRCENAGNNQHVISSCSMSSGSCLDRWWCNCVQTGNTSAQNYVDSSIQQNLEARPLGYAQIFLSHQKRVVMPLGSPSNLRLHLGVLAESQYDTKKFRFVQHTNNKIKTRGRPAHKRISPRIYACISRSVMSSSLLPETPAVKRMLRMALFSSTLECGDAPNSPPIASSTTFFRTYLGMNSSTSSYAQKSREWSRGYRQGRGPRSLIRMEDDETPNL